MFLSLWVGLGAGGCTGGGGLECLPTEQVDAWADEDGDGYGSGTPQRVCAVPEELVDNGLDCDDADPLVHPGAEEVCNARDDDCDGQLDDGFDGRRYHRDEDGDGFGVRYPAQFACAHPGDGWVENTDDCDDGHPKRNPAADEVCNGVDDDCDGDVDDNDADLVVSTTTRWFRDGDADGYGNDLVEVRACVAPGGYVEDFTDCNDDRASVHPGAEEIPANHIDENCNQLEACYHDADLDRARAETWEEVDAPRCDLTGYAPASWPIDCNDDDPLVNVDIDWLVDGDDDGFGAGLPVATRCDHPGGQVVPATPRLDCDDADGGVYPGAIDTCYDGIDANCDGRDTCATCRDWRDTLGAAATDGVYALELGEDQLREVWCDMTTDGGGWTLVAATRAATLDDRAGAWHEDLVTLTPAAGHSAVWAGLRGVVSGAHDMRFACKSTWSNPTMTVDLSFYRVPWYHVVTSGDDGQSCFNPVSGGAVTPPVPPMRRNNLNGVVLPEGDAWNAGRHVGEDSCTDSGDFTVDFDDRGMDSNQYDGTDWGEDDSSMKCGSSTASSGAWFLFVR